MSNSQKALSKEYITRCVVCNKFIPEDIQTSTRNTCSIFCHRKSKRNNRLRNSNRVVTLTDPVLTRKKMQDEINSLCSNKKNT